MSNLPKYIKTFSRLEVAVIGDLMLDKYIFGSATRISQEAPVPVVCVAPGSRKTGRAGPGRKNGLGRPV